MSISVDEAGVVLDADGWQALLTGEADERDLRAAHGVEGTSYAVAAGRQPVAIMQLQVTTPAGVFGHYGWIAYQAVALLIDRGDGRHRLMAVAPDHLAISLARLCGVGPRARIAREARRVDEVQLQRWFDDDPVRRNDELARLGADRAWQLLIQPAGEPGQEPGAEHSGWVSPGVPEEETILMAAADGPGGAWLVEPGATGLRLEPVTPTWLFRALAGVLDQLP